MKEVYILNNELDKVYKNKKSLLVAIKEKFKNECAGEIREVLIGDKQSISITYELEYEEVKTYTAYFYRKIKVI